MKNVENKEHLFELVLYSVWNRDRYCSVDIETDGNKKQIVIS